MNPLRLLLTPLVWLLWPPLILCSLAAAGLAWLLDLLDGLTGGPLAGPWE